MLLLLLLLLELVRELHHLTQILKSQFPSILLSDTTSQKSISLYVSYVKVTTESTIEKLRP